MEKALDNVTLGTWAVRGAQVALIAFWTVYFVVYSDAYAVFYVLCGAAGCVGAIWGKGEGESDAGEDGEVARANSLGPRARKAVTWAFAALFAIAGVAANYAFVSGPVLAVLLLVAGFAVGRGALLAALMAYDRAARAWAKAAPAGGASSDADATLSPNVPWRAFAIPFAVLAAVYLVVLFVAQFPGNLAYDSVFQIRQLSEGALTNHHPYWHTMAVSFCLNVGEALFGSLNAGVAIYSVGQALFMAACVGFGTLTMRQAGCPRWAVAVVTALFALLPYHLIYSVTMWKNTPFGCCGLLFSVGLFRIVAGIGRSRWPSWCALVVGGMGFALLQQNGWYALVGCAVVFALAGGKQRRAIAGATLGMLAVSFALTHVVVPALGIAAESENMMLSIPAQQMTRTVTEGSATAEELEQLAEFADVEGMAEVYDPILSDPVRTKLNNEAYLANRAGFFGLWAKLGIAHPGAYFRAFVDQTRGYWFGGYEYWYVAPFIYENEFGIERTASATASDLLVRYADEFQQLAPLKPFVSIGLATWLALACLAACALRRNRAGALMAVPALMVVGTLLISTPVFSEFRYVYSLYMVLPFLVFASPAVAGRVARGESLPELPAVAGRGELLPESPAVTARESHKERGQVVEDGAREEDHAE